MLSQSQNLKHQRIVAQLLGLYRKNARFYSTESWKLGGIFKTVRFNRVLIHIFRTSRGIFLLVSKVLFLGNARECIYRAVKLVNQNQKLHAIPNVNYSMGRNAK